VSCRITRNPVADNTSIKNNTEIDLIFRVKISTNICNMDYFGLLASIHLVLYIEKLILITRIVIMTISE
jgi:hypothetical protein